MFGVLVVSSRNEVLFASGNAAFREQLYEKLEREVYRPFDVASTSSGFCTDSEPSPTSSFDRSSIRSMKESGGSELPAISHVFLPLISTYRATLEAGSPFESISQGPSIIRFKSLDHSAVVICITEKETAEHVEFLDYFVLQLRLLFGPLLELINSHLTPVEDSLRKLEDIIEDFCRGRRFSINGYLDCCRTATHISQLPRINAIVKSICDQLAIFIGNNRCFLMRGHEIISTVNSSASGRPVCKQLLVDDLNAIFDTMTPLTAERNSEISQYWVRSTFSPTPFYVDVIRFRLNAKLELFCISESRSNVIIRTITLLMDELEQIPEKTDELAEHLAHLEKHVDVVTKLLMEMVFDKPQSAVATSSSFLRNPSKTANYFKSLWQRLLSDLSREFGESAIHLTRRPFFSHLRSTLSMLSISTFGSHLALIPKKNSLPVQINVLLSYVHKQILNLLQEVCADVRKDAAKYKLGLFHTSIKRIFRPRQEAQLQREGVGEGWSDDASLRLFAPCDLRLAMYAYSIANETHHLQFSFAPDSYKHLLSRPSSSDHDLSFSDGKTEEGEEVYVVHYRFPLKKAAAKRGILKKIVGESKYQEEILNCKAVFSSYVHKNLAMTQVHKLVQSLEPFISTCSKFYN